MAQGDPTIITGDTFPGGTGIPAIEDALQANASMHSGDTAPSYAVLGTLWLDTSGGDPYTISVYDGTDWVEFATLDAGDDTCGAAAATVLVHTAEAFTSADATPSVASRQAVYKTGNLAATTITTFDNGVTGQAFTLIVADANTTIAAALTATGMVIPLVAGDTLQWVYTGAAWKQVAGSVGMGRYVPLAASDEIGDWIATNITAYADVDVSDDSVRKGACAVLININLSRSGFCSLQVRGKGTTNVVLMMAGSSSTLSTSYAGLSAIVSLDNNAVFEAAYASSVTSGSASVNGYFI